jgi:lysozyme family protein
MQSNFDTAFKHVLQSEGGFSDDPRDPGGMTNLGVTKRTWERWTGREVIEQEMRDLTPEQVAPLYKTEYWDAVSADLLPAGLDYAVFDFAVNAGSMRAITVLQQVVRVNPDGIIGKKTLAAIETMGCRQVIKKFSEVRDAFYRSLTTFPTFGKDWIERTAEVERTALAMEA